MTPTTRHTWIFFCCVVLYIAHRQWNIFFVIFTLWYCCILLLNIFCFVLFYVSFMLQPTTAPKVGWCAIVCTWPYLIDHIWWTYTLTADNESPLVWFMVFFFTLNWWLKIHQVYLFCCKSWFWKAAKHSGSFVSWLLAQSSVWQAAKHSGSSVSWLLSQ